MEIKKLSFEKKEIQIKETYIDKDGHIKECIKTILIPTGKLCTADAETGAGDQKQKS